MQDDTYSSACHTYILGSAWSYCGHREDSQRRRERLLPNDLRQTEIRQLNSQLLVHKQDVLRFDITVYYVPLVLLISSGYVHASEEHRLS